MEKEVERSITVAPKAHLLIVDDEPNTLASLSRAFRLEGHEATVCDNAARALELATTQPFDLILSDVVMPGKDGLALLEELKAQGVPTPVVMMSGQAHIEMAVRATRLGALDFLEKPISTDKLLLTVENALKLGRLERQNRDLERRLGKHEIVWTGETMRRVMAQVERVAASETRVCIFGETGTGKELVARTLHERSPRAAAPFITLNCAAVPAELIESELFGHEKGSFTGAAARHLGKFEQAQHGTIFLDEIGDMPLTMQAKLLRVLEEGEVERIGGDRSIAVDVRVVVATHRDLEALMREGKFRQDLFHRIYVFPLRLPPLRERREDIPVAGRALRRASQRDQQLEADEIHRRRDRRTPATLVARQHPRTAQRGRAPDAAGDVQRSHRGNRGFSFARIVWLARSRVCRIRSAGRPRPRLRKANYPCRTQAQSPSDFKHGSSARPGAIPSL